LLLFSQTSPQPTSLQNTQLTATFRIRSAPLPQKPALHPRPKLKSPKTLPRSATHFSAFPALLSQNREQTPKRPLSLPLLQRLPKITSKPSDTKGPPLHLQDGPAPSSSQPFQQGGRQSI
jgi:hypothetical protein